ncbi:DUF5694 domain-containing protein [Halobacteriaceae archaeon GCM10025711]
MNSPSSSMDATRWPDCDAEQVSVMLFGTYHMDNPGLDEVNVDADDVLAPDRQREAVALTRRIAEWEPDTVAVERPYDRYDDVNALYEAYRSGERRYDREETFDPPHPQRDDETTECRSEVVQVGFRLADTLDHDRVVPIDYPMDPSNDDLAALEARGFDPDETVPVSLPDAEAAGREHAERLASSTLTEYHRWLNQDARQRLNHASLFGRYVRWGEGDNFGGPRLLARWYDRNLRMVHNLWRSLAAGDRRVLVLVGNGHVRVLRHLLTETPQFCPVSPRPYLSRSDPAGRVASGC